MRENKRKAKFCEVMKDEMRKVKLGWNLNDLMKILEVK